MIWKDLTEEDIQIMEELEWRGVKLDMKEILRCVDNAEWQKFRKSLKGLSTAEKLRKLRSYRSSHTSRCDKVRVENYLNALRRGGQLPPKKS